MRLDRKTTGRKRSKFSGKVVREHILIVETILGRALPAEVQIHHVDNNEHNNRNSNLVVCPNQAYHKLLHQRTEALDACGNPNYRRCVFCKAWDEPGNMKQRSYDRQYQHRSCARDYQIRRRRREQTAIP